jgi:hypothetical protein
MNYIHNFLDWCCHLHSSCISVMQWYMIVLAYVGSLCIKLHSWMGMLIFYIPVFGVM